MTGSAVVCAIAKAMATSSATTGLSLRMETLVRYS